MTKLTFCLPGTSITSRKVTVSQSHERYTFLNCDFLTDVYFSNDSNLLSFIIHSYKTFFSFYTD